MISREPAVVTLDPNPVLALVAIGCCGKVRRFDRLAVELPGNTFWRGFTSRRA